MKLLMLKCKFVIFGKRIVRDQIQKPMEIKPMEMIRRFTRVECKMKAFVQLDNVMIVEASILNISLKGAFFELPDYYLFQIGDKWQLKFILPNSDIKLQFKTEVVHSQKKLVGVKFIHIDIDTMIHLRSLLEGRTSNSVQVEREIELLYGSEKPT